MVLLDELLQNFETYSHPSSHNQIHVFEENRVSVTVKPFIVRFSKSAEDPGWYVTGNGFCDIVRECVRVAENVIHEHQ